MSTSDYFASLQEEYTSLQYMGMSRGTTDLSGDLASLVTLRASGKGVEDSISDPLDKKSIKLKEMLCQEVDNISLKASAVFGFSYK